MGSYLSKKTKLRSDENGITEVDKAVLSLRTQRRKLNAERKRLDEIMEKNVVAIKELLLRKDTSRALLALKKKKMREEQIQSVDKWLLNVEQLLGNLELAQHQNALFAALRSGADAMKEIQKEVKLEDVDKLTEDTAEAKAYMDEIHEALAADSSGEMEELQEELDALEKDILQQEINEMPTTPEVPLNLPSVPTEAMEQPNPKKARTEEPLVA